jgi:antitoxin FitA
MPSVQIKGVPERTLSVLRQRAAAAHQSFQEYLLKLLIEEADRPTPDGFLIAQAAELAAPPASMRSMP